MLTIAGGIIIAVVALVLWRLALILAGVALAGYVVMLAIYGTGGWDVFADVILTFVGGAFVFGWLSAMSIDREIAKTPPL